MCTSFLSRSLRRTLPILLAGFLGCSGSAATHIADARSMADSSEVSVSGTVTVAPGAFVSALDAGFGLQDDSGGIWISLDAKDSKPAIAKGDRVKVRGRLMDVAKLRVLSASAAAVERDGQGTGTDIAPRQAQTGAVNESTEGQIVRVTGQVTRAVVDDAPYGYKLFINDGSGEIQIFCHASAGFNLTTLQSFVQGQRVQATGLSMQYETTYEVSPREPGELTRVE